jgi:hypothetical protein
VFNPSTGDFPIFDAMVDEPSIHLIKGVQEGAVVAMADGYARLWQDRHRRSSQYRAAERHDPDGQQRKDQDPDPGRGRFGRADALGRDDAGRPTTSTT